MRNLGEFQVSVTKDYLVFASAHFITFEGHRCEGLHGHNYRASVTVEGPLNEECWFVFDFMELKRHMRQLCDEIDHKVLLPLENPRVQVVDEGTVVRVAVDGKPRYMFPTAECALLPVPNTTVEMIARLLATRLHDNLASAGVRTLTAIVMEIEENFGQSAVYRMSLP
jgi:6-pyruvoyltetrahydropterin/6-carboxytetrahydropterin synthase